MARKSQKSSKLKDKQNVEPEWRKDVEKIFQEISKIVGQDFCSSAHLDKLAYQGDSWPRLVLDYKNNKQMPMPDLIVWPNSSSEIAKILQVAEKWQIPVIPYGGGSGVCGGTIPVYGGIILDLKRMDRILKIDEDTMIAHVESGIIGEILERKLNARGFTLGHFPGSIYSATLGGYMAVRGAGQYSSYYGTIVDIVKGITAVFPNGQVVHSVGKCHHGTQWDQLLMGAEGTLGVITEAKVKIHKKPVVTMMRGIYCESVEEGLHLIQMIMQSGLKPSLLRLYDEFDSMVNRVTQVIFTQTSNIDQDRNVVENAISHIWQAANRFAPFRLAQDFVADKMVQGLSFFLKQAPWVNQMIDILPTKVLLLISFEGMDQNIVAKNIDIVLDMAKKMRCSDGGEAPAKSWYRHRYKMAFNRSPIFQGNAFVDRLEVATSWDNALNIYHKVREHISSEVFTMAHFSHAYRDGVAILFTYAGAMEDPSQNQELYNKVTNEILEIVSNEGGTISHHHGIGLSRGYYLEKELGPGMEYLQALKSTLDPKGILNPGKLMLMGER